MVNNSININKENNHCLTSKSPKIKKRPQHIPLIIYIIPWKIAVRVNNFGKDHFTVHIQ
jgi:hypothetical protein